MSQKLQIDVFAYRHLRDSGTAHVLLDVREPWELKLARLDGSRDIPMAQVPERVADLPDDQPIIVLCHHGARSLQVTQWLRSRGFENAINLGGGIDAWSLSVDPSVPRY